MLDILCFGNSLTQGFWHYGLEEPHPYALALKETLVEDEIVEGEIEIDVEGKPGDLVNCPPGQFIDRMRRRCTFPRFIYLFIFLEFRSSLTFL